MVKYPSLDGRKRKVYMSKAELPEAQVLTDLHSVDNAWIEHLARRRKGHKPNSDGACGWCCLQKRGYGSHLIESALYQRIQWDVVFPIKFDNCIQLLWRADAKSD